MKKLILILLAFCFASMGRAEIGIRYLDYTPTSHYLSSRYGAELHRTTALTPVGATTVNLDYSYGETGGRRPRYAYGTDDDEDGFFDDDEDFDDVYTKEPGDLPVGDVPWWMLLALFVTRRKKDEY